MSRNQLNRVWKALSDPNRREILELLREKPRTTGELCLRFRKLSRFAVMKHLNLLESSSLVKSRREGRYRWNHLDPAPLREIDRQWLRPYRHVSRKQGSRKQAS